MTFTRWTPTRKLLVVADLLGGYRDRQETCRFYDLTNEELDEWLTAHRIEGLPGLSVTKRLPRRQRPATRS